jgi:hypothetical protein
MKTFSVPGGAAGPPSACSSGLNRVDVFAVTGNRRVCRVSQDGANWLAPVELPVPGGARGYAPEGICAVSSGPGRVEVFAVEDGTRGPTWWRGTDGSFALAPLPPGGMGIPSVPVAAACVSPDDIDVFAVTERQTPCWWHWNGSGWSAPVLLPGGAAVPEVRIAALRPAPGRLDVFAVGANTHLWHWSKVGAGGWTVRDLGGSLPAVGVSAVSWGTNRIDVFGAGRDAAGSLLHWWSEGGAFAGPETLGTNFAPSSVSAVSHGPYRLDCFGVTRDQKLGHVHWDGYSWHGPRLRGEQVPTGDVSLVVRPYRRLDAFVAGAGGSVRKWPGGGTENAWAQAWKNWPENVVKNPPLGRLSPDSLEELVNIVREASQQGLGVRAVGSGWSNSEAALASHYVVETDRLCHHVDDVFATSLTSATAGRHLVHVEAGIKLHAINTWLDARGLALTTVGGASGQSLAGALSTSTHGSDIDRGPLTEMVRAIHLVAADGSQHWIEPRQTYPPPKGPIAGGGLKQVWPTTVTDGAKLAAALSIPLENVHYDDDWFNSALVSVGALGIIYSVVLEVVPQYDLVETRQPMDWGSLRQLLAAAGGRTDRPPFAGNRAVTVVINPYPAGDGSRRCWLETRKPEIASVPYRSGNEAEFLGVGYALLAGIWHWGAREAIDDVVNELTTRREMIGEPIRGWGNTVMGPKDPPKAKGLTVEVAFDATQTKYLDFIDAALNIIKTAYYDESPSRGYLGYVSLRFQGRSRALLSMQNRSTLNCTIEFAALSQLESGLLPWPDTEILIHRIEAEGRKFGGIQHWGLNLDVNGLDVARAYPGLNTWRRVRWQLTRSGRFRTFDSDFTRKTGLSNPPLQGDAADWDLDTRTDLAVWRPSTGLWRITNSETQTQRYMYWGLNGDVPVPGDYDGDGKIDFAVWRPSTGAWHVIHSSDGRYVVRQWGQPGDIPVPGDYDGDGRTDFAVWRPSDGVWYVIESSTGRDVRRQWGQVGDIPVPGRYDSDNRNDFAIWRPSTGAWWILSNDGTNAYRSVYWGLAGDVPVAADYDSDGRTDCAVWRPSNGTWYVIESATGLQRTRQWGQPGDVPVPGRYDGDTRIDFAVWRPSNGTWYIVDSSTGAQRQHAWGVAGDIPVARV